MKTYLFILFSFFSASISLGQATSISGVINTYTAVTLIDTSACNDVITVTSASGFTAGDTVMIIQMKGASIDVTNTASFGSLTAYNSAGNYEFAIVATITGNQIGISGILQNTYEISGYVQLVTVPVYTDANVTAPLTAQDWNGITGGILVFFVSDTLYMNADIHLNGKGFRGGTISNNPDGGCGNNSINDYFYNVNQGGGSWSEGGAEKGEGIAEIPANQMGGKGCLANGGGGGNKHNTGGGGGGNYTSGGKGGNEMGGCTQNGNGGIGGVDMSYSSNKIFLGGGGGCGDFNNNVGTVGTDAGGMIIIGAGTLVASGYTMHANGLDQTGSIGSIGDGAGGGGAGGTILLDVSNYSGNLIIQANGGDGGDQTASNTYGCFGPGGGGGTGLIWISGTSLPANVSTEMLPGAAGIVMNSSFSCYNTTYGAVDGSTSPSPYLTDFILPYPVPGSSGFPIVDLGNDTMLCLGSVFTLDATQPVSTYLWSNGDTTASINVDVSGTYWVQVDNGCGIGSDTINILFVPTPLVSLGNDTTLCAGTIFLLDGAVTGASYLWQDSSTNSQLLVDSAGTYSLTVGVGNCIDYDTIDISYYLPLDLDLGNDTFVCFQSTLVLDAFNPNSVFYLWQDGSTDPTFTADTAGTYVVTITDSLGCNASDSILILDKFPPIVNLGNDTIACPGTVILLDATDEDALSYLWNTNETTPALEASDTGHYWVVVTNACGSSTDSFLMKFIDCNLDVFVPNAFSPNGDGLNDEFNPITSNISSYHLSIFNRWGRLMFATSDPENGWDGTWSNVEQEIGVYVYVINYTATFDPDHEQRQLKGNLTLIR